MELYTIMLEDGTTKKVTEEEFHKTIDALIGSNTERKEFVDYLVSFYGDGGLYSDEFYRPVTRHEIEKAFYQYLVKPGTEFDGDSFDREAVRDILMDNLNK